MKRAANEAGGAAALWSHFESSSFSCLISTIIEILSRLFSSLLMEDNSLGLMKKQTLVLLQVLSVGETLGFIRYIESKISACFPDIIPEIFDTVWEILKY